MVKTTRGLFDPRQKNVAWPEPNDDPNIPYVWGLNGVSSVLNTATSVVEAASTLQEANTQSTSNNVQEPLEITGGDLSVSPNPTLEQSKVNALRAKREPLPSAVGGILISTMAISGLYGFSKGLMEGSEDASALAKLGNGLLKGVLYSSLIGIAFEKKP